LEEWLGYHPNQAADITRLALSAAFIALKAGSAASGAQFAQLVVDASAFRPLSHPDDVAITVFGAVLLAEAELDAGHSLESGTALQYARALIGRMDQATALCVWARAQCDLAAGSAAEVLLERRQATAWYEAAIASLEPLVRNVRLHRELVGEWLQLVFGDAQRLVGQEAQAQEMVLQLVRAGYVAAVLGRARMADADRAGEACVAAAAACTEFDVPSHMSLADVHAALQRLPATARLNTLNKLLDRLGSADDRKSHALAATLLALRASTPSNRDALTDFARARKAAKVAADAGTWTVVTAELADYNSRHKMGTGGDSSAMFLRAFTKAERGVRGTPRHLPFRAHFEPALNRVTADALVAWLADPTLDTSVHLSSCLEASRTPDVEVGRRRAEGDQGQLAQARTAARDWLGRIVHAVQRPRPARGRKASGPSDTLVLIPTSLPDGLSWLCIARGTAAVEVHRASAVFASAAQSLTMALRRQFEGKRRTADLAKPGRAAWAALPGRVRDLIETSRSLLVVPELTGERSAFPYELLHGPSGFLGVTHVVARALTLRDAAFALEPKVLPVPASRRAVCVAAPDTVPTEPLRFASREAEGVRKRLAKAKWKVPVLEDAQLTPDLLLEGLELASVVHVAAHGEGFGGAYSILLPRGERLTTDAMASYRGRLGALAYLSVCSAGSSEYLGGGVSRGIGATLASRGSPAIIATPWPLEDACAEQLATAFYDAALGATVGEAMRAARARLAEHIPAALWGSVIFVGNPWHRLHGAKEPDDDATTVLLRVATDQDADDAARTTGFVAARLALAADPEDRRLAAALAWIEEGETPPEPDSPKPEWADEMAAVGGDLGTPVGEALYRAAAAESHAELDRGDPARSSLDRAIDLFEWIASANERWRPILQGLLARRQTMDLRFEIPEIKLDSGMTVNDRSDPAIRAVLDVQHAVDQQSTRKGGALRLRLPERSVDDLCWNAVVLGQRGRFPDEFACAGFARLLATRAVGAGWITPEREADWRRVAAGTLRFLWLAQRMTHLERERCLGQSGTLRVALESVARHAGAEAWQVPLRQQYEQLLTTAGGRPEDRFARTRERLGGGTSAPTPGSLGAAVAAAIEATERDDTGRAYRGAWCHGLLLDLAYELRLKGNAPLADQVLAVASPMKRQSERRLMAWLVEGHGALRNIPLDPLIGWRYPQRPRASRTRPPGKTGRAVRMRANKTRARRRG
jgi:hypothetical protein